MDRKLNYLGYNLKCLKLVWTKVLFSPVGSRVLTVSHWVSIGQAETGQVNHAVRQVDVEATHCCLQVAQLVQDHHAALHHWHHGSSC